MAAKFRQSITQVLGRESLRTMLICQVFQVIHSLIDACHISLNDISITRHGGSYAYQAYLYNLISVSI